LSLRAFEHGGIFIVPHVYCEISLDGFEELENKKVDIAVMKTAVMLSITLLSI
jgi:hypothetical protein